MKDARTQFLPIEKLPASSNVEEDNLFEPFSLNEVFRAGREEENMEHGGLGTNNSWVLPASESCAFQDSEEPLFPETQLATNHQDTRDQKSQINSIRNILTDACNIDEEWDDLFDPLPVETLARFLSSTTTTPPISHSVEDVLQTTDESLFQVFDDTPVRMPYM